MWGRELRWGAVWRKNEKTVLKKLGPEGAKWTKLHCVSLGREERGHWARRECCFYWRQMLSSKPSFSLLLRLIVTNRQDPWCGHVALTAHCWLFPMRLKGAFLLLPLSDIDKSQCYFSNHCLIFKLDFCGTWIMTILAWHPGFILVSVRATGSSLAKFQPSAVRINL